MARRVFFSFHYERDIWRASQIRNSWVTKTDRESAGFWDAAKWEQVKKRGDNAIRKWIDDNLNGTSVTAVLIGSETSNRKWVRYEIEKSLEKGNYVFGVRIHNLKDQRGETDWPGDLDFGILGGEDTFSELFHVYDWVDDKGYDNFASWVENTVPNSSNNIGFWDAIAVTVIAAFGYGILSSWFRPRCPQCNEKTVKGVQVCPNCGTYLK